MQIQSNEHFSCPLHFSIFLCIPPAFQWDYFTATTEYDFYRVVMDPKPYQTSEISLGPGRNVPSNRAQFELQEPKLVGTVVAKAKTILSQMGT